MNDYKYNYQEFVIRCECRTHYRATGELDAPSDYNESEQAIWDSEVQQIQRDEAQLV